MDGTEKKKLIHKRKEKYQSIDTTKKKKLFQKGTEKCESMDIEAKRDLLNKRKVRIKVKATSMESRVKQFKRKIREGPYFICTVCNRILYKKSVMRCINNKCPCQTFFNIQQSFDGKEYNIICKTCPSKVIKGELPCQAVVNNMYVDETPTQLASLETRRFSSTKNAKIEEAFRKKYPNVTVGLRRDQFQLHFRDNTGKGSLSGEKIKISRKVVGTSDGKCWSISSADDVFCKIFELFICR